MAIVAFACVASVVALTSAVSYQKDNYQWVLGAELQALAGVLALVTSGTFIAGQIGQSTTQRVSLILPMDAFWLAISVTVLALSFDVATLAALPASADAPRRLAINGAVVGNGFALMIMLAFARLLLDWTQPSKYLEQLVDRFRHVPDGRLRETIVDDIEMLTRQACDRRERALCAQAVESLEELLAYCRRQTHVSSDVPKVVAAMDTVTLLYRAVGFNDLADEIAAIVALNSDEATPTAPVR